jgi:hypothetical protein
MALPSQDTSEVSQSAPAKGTGTHLPGVSGPDTMDKEEVMVTRVTSFGDLAEIQIALWRDSRRAAIHLKDVTPPHQAVTEP